MNYLKSAVFLVMIANLLCCCANGQNGWQEYSLTDVGLKEKVTKELRSLVQDLDLGLRDCLCDWSLKFESAADSERLFSSVGRFKFFQSAEGAIWSSSEWKNTVLADDRAARDKSKGLFINCEYERLLIDGKSYNRDDQKVHLDSQDSRYRLSSCLVPNPLAIPFFHPACLSTMHPCDGGEAFFGVLTECVATSESNGIVESIWLDADADGKSLAFHHVASKNGLPIRFEFFMVPNGFKIDNGLPQRKDCKSVSFVSTKWTELDGIAVPASCYGSLACPYPKAGAEVLSFEATMKFFDSQSKEYKEKSAELTPAIDKITSEGKKKAQE